MALTLNFAKSNQPIYSKEGTNTFLKGGCFGNGENIEYVQKLLFSKTFQFQHIFIQKGE